MNTQSALATREILQIVNPGQSKMKELFINEPELKVCRACGEVEGKSCLCDALTKARLRISEAILAAGFQWLSNDALDCDAMTLRRYSNIAAFFSPSRELWTATKESGIPSDYYKCGFCGSLKRPEYFYGKDTILCKTCTRELLN